MAEEDGGPGRVREDEKEAGECSSGVGRVVDVELDDGETCVVRETVFAAKSEISSLGAVRSSPASQTIVSCERFIRENASHFASFCDFCNFCKFFCPVLHNLAYFNTLKKDAKG